MSSIIEQAAKRLEELRRSGVDVDTQRAAAPPAASPQARPEPVAPQVAPGAAAASPAVVAEPLRAKRRSVSDGPRSNPGDSQSGHVAQIDLARLAALGYVTPDNPRSTIADEFRVIKRPLLNHIQAEDGASRNAPNLIMVTSSMPGEGKTFVATNLAMSLAMEYNRTVLLVDADVSRPSVLTRLGIAPSRGLLDVLTDADLDLAEVLLRTSVDGLTVLPAGSPQARATEILASDAMNDLIEDLASRYPDRVIVFDAPPLLPSTESRVLATHMGQVVLVVEANHTPNRTVEQALATIESCPVVLPLLNKTSKSEVGSYYGLYGPLDA